jgi:hypothetical protein
MPGHTAESLTALLAQLSDDQFRDIFTNTFKLNTAWNITHAALALARKGWFIELDVPPSVVVTWAGLGDEEGDVSIPSIDAYFQARRPDIERELVAAFPARERFFRAGFRAHDAGEYESSVVLFLVQADGICQDAFGAELYRIKGGASAMQTKLKHKTVDFVWDAAVAPLYAALPLALHEKPGRGKFNRHLILHGRSLDYPTRENSLRAISLLSYLRNMVSYEAKRNKDASISSAGSNPPKSDLP